MRYAGNKDPGARQFFERVQTSKRATVCHTDAPCLILHLVHSQLGDSRRAEQKLLLPDAHTVGMQMT